MSTSTRRRLLVCALVLAFTIPMESILLKAVSTTDSRLAIRTWVAGLSPADLELVAHQAQAYPFAYRQEIMRALAPARRSHIWQRHIGRYLEAHPDLDAAAVQALNDAMSAASTEAFDNPTDVTLARVNAAGAQLVVTLGKEEADYVFYRLGPRDGTFASIEPVGMKLAEFIRRTYVAIARADDCDCNQGWGCDGWGVYCSDQTGCRPVDPWPACGWLWDSTCDGGCRVGIRM